MKISLVIFCLLISSQSFAQEEKVVDLGKITFDSKVKSGSFQLIKDQKLLEQILHNQIKTELIELEKKLIQKIEGNTHD